MNEYYPEFPRDVVTLYSRIVKQYYFEELTETEIEKLAGQARLMFDQELLDANPLDQFLEDLKTDISNYNNVGRRIHDYKVEKSQDIDMFTFEEKEYAIVSASYLVREGSNVLYVNEDYTLRKDEEGRWKILYWESVNPSIE